MDSLPPLFILNDTRKDVSFEGFAKYFTLSLLVPRIVDSMV